jgi:hypothetical protein
MQIAVAARSKAPSYTGFVATNSTVGMAVCLCCPECRPPCDGLIPIIRVTPTVYRIRKFKTQPKPETRAADKFIIIKY